MSLSKEWFLFLPFLISFHFFNFYLSSFKKKFSALSPFGRLMTLDQSIASCSLLLQSVCKGKGCVETDTLSKIVVFAFGQRGTCEKCHDTHTVHH